MSAGVPHAFFLFDILPLVPVLGTAESRIPRKSLSEIVHVLKQSLTRTDAMASTLESNVLEAAYPTASRTASPSVIRDKRSGTGNCHKGRCQRQGRIRDKRHRHLPSRESESSHVAATRQLTCYETVILMGDFLAREMPQVTRDCFVAHIRRCSPCHEKLLALELYLKSASRNAIRN
jgi:hypothetical protein